MGVALRDFDVGKGGKAHSWDREASDDGEKLGCSVVCLFGISNGDFRPDGREFWGGFGGTFAGAVVGSRSICSKEASFKRRSQPI